MYDQYFDILHEIMTFGVDVGINLVVVGAIVGSLLGIKGMPNYMIKNLIKSNYARIDEFSVKEHCLTLIQKILERNASIDAEDP